MLFQRHYSRTTSAEDALLMSYAALEFTNDAMRIRKVATDSTSYGPSYMGLLLPYDGSVVYGHIGPGNIKILLVASDVMLLQPPHNAEMHISRLLAEIGQYLADVRSNPFVDLYAGASIYENVGLKEKIDEFLNNNNS